MIITLEPNQTVEIRFAHSRDMHGDPLVADGVITVSYDDEMKRIRVKASEPDSTGRVGVVYQEHSGAPREHDAELSAKDAQIFEILCKIISDHLGSDLDKITLGSELMGDLGADSLDTVELIMAVEAEFGVDIPDGIADGIITVGDVLTFLRTKV